MFKPLREKITALLGIKPATAYATLDEVTQAYRTQEKHDTTGRKLMYAVHVGMLGMCGAGIAMVSAGMALPVLGIVAAATIGPVFAGVAVCAFKSSRINKQLKATKETMGREMVEAARPAEMLARIADDHANKDKLERNSNIASTVTLVAYGAAMCGFAAAFMTGVAAGAAVVGSAAYITAKTTGFIAFGIFTVASALRIQSDQLTSRKIDVICHGIDLSLREIDEARAELAALDDEPAPTVTPKPTAPAFDAAAKPDAAPDAPAPVKTAEAKPAATPKNKK